MDGVGEGHRGAGTVCEILATWSVGTAGLLVYSGKCLAWSRPPVAQHNWTKLTVFAVSPGTPPRGCHCMRH